jgi:hypothetical protein
MVVSILSKKETIARLGGGAKRLWGRWWMRLEWGGEAVRSSQCESVDSTGSLAPSRPSLLSMRGRYVRSVAVLGKDPCGCGESAVSLFIAILTWSGSE